MVYRHSQCEHTCQFVEANNMRIRANAIVAQAQSTLGGIGKVSNALWCDHGQHAFSENDQGRRHFTESKYSPDRDETVTEVIDWCGECAAKLMEARKAIS